MMQIKINISSNNPFSIILNNPFSILTTTKHNRQIHTSSRILNNSNKDIRNLPVLLIKNKSPIIVDYNYFLFNYLEIIKSIITNLDLNKYEAQTNRKSLCRSCN